MAQAEHAQPGRFFSFGSFFGGKGGGAFRGEKPSLANLQESVPLEPVPLEPVLGDEIELAVPTDGSLRLVDGSGTEDRRSLIEEWKHLPARKDRYEEDMYDDGTPYGPGVRLLVFRDVVETVEGRPRRKRVTEQVMDDFEVPWCDATVNAMFQGKDGELTVLERGFGLGLMADRINWQMRSRGGKHIIVELNNDIFKDAEQWAERKRRELRSRPGREVTIQIIPGDADEAIQAFPPSYFDLIFSDTHQLREEERGINDLLELEELKTRMKPDGRFTFCAFHRDNQTGDIDPRQRMLITPHFKRGYGVIPVELVPPKDCTYLVGPRKIVPAVVCYEPRLSAGAA